MTARDLLIAAACFFGLILVTQAATISTIASLTNVNISQRGGSSAALDPCETNAKSFVKVSLTANTQLIAGTSGKQTYFCSYNFVVASAVGVAVVEGTGSTCGTGTLGTVSGGATAATGWQFGANGGEVSSPGNSSVGATATGGGGSNVCVFVSSAVQVSGNIGYVQQ